MKRIYPYLQDSYYTDANKSKQLRRTLQKIDDFVNQKRYVRITLLDWEENPLKEIQGDLISGNLTKDGHSSVRRICSFSASVGRGVYDLENTEMDFAINKKIFLEIGVKNYTSEYPEYPIFWFPQGVFFITSFSMNSSTSSAVNISLQLKDKMCKLNGEIGGTFPATTILDTVDTQSKSGQFVTQKVLIYNIIQELVNHFGDENLNNIVIEDVPLRIKRIMKWTGDYPIWLVPNESEDGKIWYEVKTSKEEGSIQINNGVDAGYVYDDFVYSSELVAAPGESVCQVLDKIKQYLGNYEYFYDEFGVFHFREIKNYMNTSQASTLIQDMDAHDYLVDVTLGKDVHTFSDNSNLIGISVTPQYQNIKNDYIVQGLRKGTQSDQAFPVIYHLAIDKKPELGTEYFNLLIYEEPRTHLKQMAFPELKNSVADLPIVGEFNTIYGLRDKLGLTPAKSLNLLEENTPDNDKPNSEDIGPFVYWENNVYKNIKDIKYFPRAEDMSQSDTTLKGYIAKDWRTEIYLQGLTGKRIGQRYSYYFPELEAFWPQIYDVENQTFYGETVLDISKDGSQDMGLVLGSLTNGNYYLDFIEPSTSQLGTFCVSNIGRRTNVTKNDDINCLFQPHIPDIVYLNLDSDDVEDLEERRIECQTLGQPFTQVKRDIFVGFATGGYKNGAFDQIKYDLYLHTNYQQSLSLTALPIFYLEPNCRIQINDKSTNTKGSYLVTNISLPLAPGSPMTLTAVECAERF